MRFGLFYEHQLPRPWTRTQRIRLGHGIVQTSPLYNHLARVAERAATLDLLSDGRLELGTGESATTMEMGGYGVTLADKEAQWKEGLHAVVRCMTETPCGGIDGQWVSMPPRNVVPKPRQQPHPPLWMACSRRDSIIKAAELELGALTFAFIDPRRRVLVGRCLRAPPRAREPGRPAHGTRA
jgi:alkanesulfonate monooxygenase SsuD/methylene tetrahydromethanopterin reductase-like flavin-dependent oxidoreductase (luciferase family)